jgi:hypothetical protein
MGFSFFSISLRFFSPGASTLSLRNVLGIGSVVYLFIIMVAAGLFFERSYRLSLSWERSTFR